MKQRQDVANLIRPGAIAVELGVAEGEFSERLLNHPNIGYLYSIDMWGGDRNHDVEEYKRTIQRLHPYRHRNSILRLRFDEAVSLFSDGYFDLIYVDGYAHTGQEGGETLKQWWPKLKKGGVFSGDDYHPRWPKTVAVVDQFCASRQLTLNVIECSEDNRWSEYPTWWTTK